jgi:hypothetical protein
VLRAFKHSICGAVSSSLEGPDKSLLFEADFDLTLSSLIGSFIQQFQHVLPRILVKPQSLFE